MKCDLCGDNLNNSEFFKLEFSTKNGGSNSSLFCSKRCYNKFIGNEKIDKYKLIELSRCSGYEYCLKLDNLRRMCEREKIIKDTITKNSNNPFSQPMINPLSTIQWCEPAQVSIIKSSVKLLESLEEFDKKSSEMSNKTLELNENIQRISKDTLKHTKVMTYLTIAILIATAINVILFIFS